MGKCFAGLAVCFAALAAGPSAQEMSSPESAASIDPAVVSLVEAWGARLEDMGDRRIRVFDAFDEIRPDGQKIQLAHVRTVTVNPPNRLRIETEGDQARRTFIYDGSVITLADHDIGVYGQIEFEGTIPEVVDHLLSEYEVSTPLADFFSEDPAGDLMAGVTQAEIVGSGLVGERDCIHVACRQDLIDWQAWFGDDEDSPQLLRMVITYKTLPLAPQYTLQLLDSETIEATDADFAFDPDGLELIPFEPTAMLEASGEEEM